jgi:hypothetical protein
MYTYEGDGDDVTTSVVITADPLRSVVVEREVTTVGGGVVMVRIVVGTGVGTGLGDEDEDGGCVVVEVGTVMEVVEPPSLVQEPNNV